MADEFYMKTYRRAAGTLVAACDKELVGKTLESGDIEVNISAHFYKDKLVGAEAILEALGYAFAGNLFGKNIVKLALKAGVINEDAVKTIASVPHAQFIRMEPV